MTRTARRGTSGRPAFSARKTLNVYARIGARLRLQELNAEAADILRLFPDLTTSRHYRKRRTISPAGRRAMSEGMRRLWARRRAAAKAAKVGAA